MSSTVDVAEFSWWLTINSMMKTEDDYLSSVFCIFKGLVGDAVTNICCPNRRVSGSYVNENLFFINTVLLPWHYSNRSTYSASGIIKEGFGIYCISIFFSNRRLPSLPLTKTLLPWYIGFCPPDRPRVEWLNGLRWFFPHIRLHRCHPWRFMGKS